MAPVATPTLRAATPVSSARAALTERPELGTVPARPHSRLVIPSTFTAPWTARKSTARFCRHDTLCTATLLLIERSVVISITSRNGGTSDQKAGPKSRSMPGHATEGSPSQRASAMRPKS